MDTYKERVGRYRILRHTDYSEVLKAEMRLKGIDPDDNWALIWSFDDKEAAEKCLDGYVNDPEWTSPHDTYKMVDAGEATIIERPIY